MIEYFIWGGGLLTSVIVLLLLGRIALRLLKEAEEEAKREAAPCSDAEKYQIDNALATKAL